MNKLLFRSAFAVGLLAIGWIGAGYVRSNPLALVMVALIAAFYLMGAMELRRFDQDTGGLLRALTGLTEPVSSLADWLTQVPASLSHIVRLRVEGERVALPGPSMSPYLAGLLVLLGMLGTFLGMVVTLNGTGLALERASDLQTMRDTLAAPVKGLGLAFGTSVAGVTASAMLGLMTALCRRARQQAAQGLDACIGTHLRGFSRIQQREAALALQQQQAQRMPELVAQLQALMVQLQAQSQQSAEQLLASQQRFQTQAESDYRALAASVGQSLQRSLAEGARLATTTIEPIVASTMGGIARETTALQGQVAGSVQRQLDGLAARVEASTRTVTESWTSVLQRHEQVGDDLARRLAQTLDSFGQTFGNRSAALVDAVAASHAALGGQVSGAMAAQIAGVTARLDAAVQGVTAGWQAALEQQRGLARALSDETRSALQSASVQFEAQSAALIRALESSNEGQQVAMAAHDGQRLAAWTEALDRITEALQRDWQQAGAQTARQQTQICETLERTAGRIAAQTEAQARSTIAEIAQLAKTASDAPRAAAEVVAELRDKLSDSLVRDSAMLEERSRIMATLNTLLDAVQHTATEQRAAIDRLVESTATWLDQAGRRFTDKVDAESARMESVSAQLTGSAVDVASLGEAFGHAVELFSQSSDRLMDHLQRVDDTLGKSIARSDEQLAYYVAQAREVIDLSLSSQKQIVDDLQRLASARAAGGDGA